MTNKKHSNVRVPKYDMYWVAAKDPFDPCPVYKVQKSTTSSTNVHGTKVDISSAEMRRWPTLSAAEAR